MPMSAPESVVAISLSFSVGTPRGFGRELVVADGGEAVAELRALDAARDRERDDHERQHQQEQVLDVGRRSTAISFGRMM